MPPPPDCDQWGDCTPYEFCNPMADGCPPPPVYCDWETQNSCYNPPAADCVSGCFGDEFCIPMEEMCPPAPVECSEVDVKCSHPPPSDCADWGDCNVYEFCMPQDEGCPPPPVECDWDTETICWDPPHPDCEVGCWGMEFCASNEHGCPPIPVQCSGNDVMCSHPAPEGCEEGGKGNKTGSPPFLIQELARREAQRDPGACAPMEFCMPESDGCPPPPVNCDWETQTLCYSPPQPDCDHGCWGTEFCSGPEGCPAQEGGEKGLECGTDDVVCSDPPAPDCADWGSCEPFEFCMSAKEGCPPPPANCNWNEETSCWNPPPKDCVDGCWGNEFCVPMHEGCPVPPVECGEGESICSTPPPPDCADWGMCDPMEWCLPVDYASHGCPPPPAYCDWDTETHCGTPPDEGCEGAACWGSEFCAPMAEGCPPIPVTCQDGQVMCSHPPPPDCDVGCHPHEFCMQEAEGCPPPPVYCDWEKETVCSTPPADGCECEGSCWPADWCAPMDVGCEGEKQKGSDSGGGFFGLLKEQGKQGKQGKLRGGKKNKKRDPAETLVRSLLWHDEMIRTHQHIKHLNAPQAVKKAQVAKKKKSTKTPKEHSKILANFRREFINQKRMIDHVKHAKVQKKEHKKAPARKLRNKNVGNHMMYEFRRIRLAAKKHPKHQKLHAVRRSK